jgi:hypothetical protein
LPKSGLSKAEILSSNEPLNILPKFGAEKPPILGSELSSNVSTEPLKILPKFGVEKPPILDSEVSSNISTEPLKMLPKFGVEGVSKLPLPDSELASNVSKDTSILINIEAPSVEASYSGSSASPSASASASPSASPSASASASTHVEEEIAFTKGRFAPLSLNVKEPFSDTPVVIPESSQIETNKN